MGLAAENQDWATQAPGILGQEIQRRREVRRVGGGVGEGWEAGNGHFLVKWDISVPLVIHTLCDRRVLWG